MALKALWTEEVVLFVLAAKDLHSLAVQLEHERLFVGAVLVIDLAACRRGLYLHWIVACTYIGERYTFDLFAPGCGWS